MRTLLGNVLGVNIVQGREASVQAEKGGGSVLLNPQLTPRGLEAGLAHHNCPGLS